MERYLKLAGSFIKNEYIMHLLMTVLFCLMSGCIMSFQNLDMQQSSNVMERYVIISGILLMTPLFMPEQDRDIWLLEKSKRMPVQRLYLVRTVLAVLFICMIIIGFLAAMYLGESSFDAPVLFRGTFCETLFLGCLGFFVSAVTNQAVIGYMAAFLYYLANMGAPKYFGKFGLMQMLRGEKDFWYWQLAAAMILIGGAILIREKTSNI